MFKYVFEKKLFVQIHVLVHENTFWFETSAVRPNKPAPLHFRRDIRCVRYSEGFQTPHWRKARRKALLATNLVDFLVFLNGFFQSGFNIAAHGFIVFIKG